MLNAAVLASSGGSENSSSTVVKSNRITWTVHLYTLWLYTTVRWEAFYWFVFFASMCHSLLTISKINRPSTKMARPVRAWLCRKDWLCRDTPRGSASKRSVEFSQRFWTAKLKQKNQIEPTKRLNHQDTIQNMKQPLTNKRLVVNFRQYL